MDTPFFTGRNYTGGIYSLSDSYRFVTPIAPKYLNINTRDFSRELNKDRKRQLLEHGDPDQLEKARLSRVAYNYSKARVENLDVLGRPRYPI